MKLAQSKDIRIAHADVYIWFVVRDKGDVGRMNEVFAQCPPFDVSLKLAQSKDIRVSHADVYTWFVVRDKGDVGKMNEVFARALGLMLCLQ